MVYAGIEFNSFKASTWGLEMVYIEQRKRS